MLRRFDGDMRIIILIQQRELFFKIGTKKRRTGDRSGIAARMGKTAIGTGFRGIGGAAIPGDTKRWVNKKAINNYRFSISSFFLSLCIWSLVNDIENFVDAGILKRFFQCFDISDECCALINNNTVYFRISRNFTRRKDFQLFAFYIAFHCSDNMNISRFDCTCNQCISADN